MLRELSSSLREAQAGWTVDDGYLGLWAWSNPSFSSTHCQRGDNGSSNGIRTQSRHLGLQESGIQK